MGKVKSLLPSEWYVILGLELLSSDVRILRHLAVDDVDRSVSRDVYVVSAGLPV